MSHKSPGRMNQFVCAVLAALYALLAGEWGNQAATSDWARPYRHAVIMRHADTLRSHGTQTWMNVCYEIRIRRETTRTEDTRQRCHVALRMRSDAALRLDCCCVCNLITTLRQRASYVRMHAFTMHAIEDVQTRQTGQGDEDGFPDGWLPFVWAE